MTNIFEQATRKKIRFETNRGVFQVEDLWDLPLTAKGDRVNLDAIAVELHDKIEAQGTKSFVKAAKKDEILNLKFEIVKHIIETKEAEAEAKVAENDKQAKREQFDILIKQAELNELAGKSPAELKAMRDAL
uniref:Uncharacterized protein n=1 Tax=Pseudomonas phage HRDY3 TaxID=3236930 RepID=A0AB39CEW9_9VIRU